MQLIITIYAIHNMMIPKLEMRFVIKKMLNEFNEIINLIFRERIDKSIVGKLINAKVNFGLDAPIKA